MSARVLVAGGGISGLVAAYRLAEHADVVLVEREAELGGKIQTRPFRGRPLDLGPDAFIARDPAATDLCRELGLGEALVAPAARSAGVFVRGGLHPLPADLVIGIPTNLAELARSGLVSRRGRWRARLDPIYPRRMHPGGGDDPSVARIVGPRLGKEVLEALVDPLVGGINASDIGALSFAAALPQLVDVVTGRRSLTRALAPLARRAPAREQGDAPPIFFGLQPGLHALVDVLEKGAAARGAEVRRQSALHWLARETANRPWRAGIGGGEDAFDAIVVALPAPTAAALLGPVDNELARVLGEISHASVATVTCAFHAASVPASIGAALGTDGGLASNGVLVARAPGRLVTAFSFTSTKWPRSANPGEVVIRASLGRHRSEDGLELDDARLIERVCTEIAETLGIVAAPLEVLVQRWPVSFPQYTSGHGARIDRIEAQAARLPGLALCGAAMRGIGIPACIRTAAAAAESVRAHLGAC